MTRDVTVYRLRSVTLAFQGLAGGLLLVFIALINLDMGAFKTGFIFLPVAIVYLWPVRASYTWSLICIFLLGIFYDFASNGPLGLWTLCYLALFIVLGGGARTTIRFPAAFLWFLLSMSFVCCLAMLLGRFALGQWPNGLEIAKSMLTTAVVFPLIFWIRRTSLIIFGGIEDPKVAI